MSIALKRAVTRRGFTAIILKDSDAFNKLHKELRAAYTSAWSGNSKRAVARALDTALTLGSSIRRADIEVIYKVLANNLGGQAMLEQLRRPMVNLGSAIYKNGAQDVLANIQFQTPDIDALEQINQGNPFWVGRSFESSTDKLISGQLESLFEDGMTREQLAAALADYCFRYDRAT